MKNSFLLPYKTLTDPFTILGYKGCMDYETNYTRGKLFEIHGGLFLGLFMKLRLNYFLLHQAEVIAPSIEKESRKGP